VQGPSDRVRAMWRRYERGATLAEVAAEFGVGSDRVGKLFRKHGFPTERAARRTKQVERARELYSLYLQGLTTAEVGERAALSEARVGQIFSDFSLPLRAAGEGPALVQRRERGRERAREMYALYEAGATLEELGTRFGITGVAVRDAFARAGLPRRRSGGRTRTSFGEPDAWQAPAQGERAERGVRRGR
jgi:hypothetical protein